MWLRWSRHWASVMSSQVIAHGLSLHNPVVGSFLALRHNPSVALLLLSFVWQMFLATTALRCTGWLNCSLLCFPYYDTASDGS